MITTVIFIGLILITGLPLKKWLSPTPVKFTSENTPKHTALRSPTIAYYFIKYALNCSIGYVLTLGLTYYFYYQSDTYLIVSIALMILSFSWPYSQKFKPNKDVLLFITGIFAYFFIHFIWIIPIIYIMTSILLNTTTLNTIITMTSLLLIYTITPSLSPLFLNINIITILILSFLFYKDIINFFNKKNNSLLHQFKLR